MTEWGGDGKSPEQESYDAMMMLGEVLVVLIIVALIVGAILIWRFW